MRSISSVAASSAPSQQKQQATAVSRDDDRSTGAFPFKLSHTFPRSGATFPSQANKQIKELGVTHNRILCFFVSLKRAIAIMLVLRYIIGIANKM